MMKDNLRPDSLEKFSGQGDLTKRLKIAILSAMKRNEPLDHILLYGPPGLGKTTIASLIAKEMGVDFVSTAASMLKDIATLSKIVLNIKRNSVLFIDEIHRLPIALEEAFYSVIEDFKFPIAINGTVINIDIPKFTFVGATTRPDLISAPMLSRFIIKEELRHYTVEELVQVLTRTAKVLNISVSDDGITELAMRSRGTPRIANNLMKRIRDFGEVRQEATISKDTVLNVLGSLSIDELGLDNSDRRYLITIRDKFAGGPVGIQTIAATVAEPEDVILTMREPYMLSKGLLTITARGRALTSLGYAHLQNHGG